MILKAHSRLNKESIEIINQKKNKKKEIISSALGFEPRITNELDSSKRIHY
jgi:hypothetical protein